MIVRRLAASEPHPQEQVPHNGRVACPTPKRTPRASSMGMRNLTLNNHSAGAPYEVLVVWVQFDLRISSFLLSTFSSLLSAAKPPAPYDVLVVWVPNRLQNSTATLGHQTQLSNPPLRRAATAAETNQRCSPRNRHPVPVHHCIIPLNRHHARRVAISAAPVPMHDLRSR